MTRLVRVVALTVAFLIAAPAHAATDYGSGKLGDWTKMTRGVSGDLATAEVIVVGDSITTACQSSLPKYIKGKTIAVGYWSGRPTKSAVDWALSLSRKPPILVMASGTNDIMTPPEFGSQVDRMKSGLPSTTQLYWVNVYAARPAYLSGDLKNAAWVNNQLRRRIPADHIADWWGQLYSTYDRGLSPASKLRDGVHPYAGQGCDLWAYTIAEVL